MPLKAIARDHGGRLTRSQATEALQGSSDAGGSERIDVLWTEMGLAADAAITKVQRTNSVSQAHLHNLTLASSLTPTCPERNLRTSNNPELRNSQGPASSTPRAASVALK